MNGPGILQLLPASSQLLGATYVAPSTYVRICKIHVNPSDDGDHYLICLVLMS